VVFILQENKTRLSEKSANSGVPITLRHPVYGGGLVVPHGVVYELTLCLRTEQNRTEQQADSSWPSRLEEGQIISGHW